MPYPTHGTSYPLSPLSSRSFDSLDKKQLIFETVRPVQSCEEIRCEQNQVNDPNWRPGFRARFPWIGFGALFTVLLCAASSCIILKFADEKSQTQWPKQIAPNVLLNIMNNIANICFGIAIGNGIAIAWWRKTLKGSSIVDLHRSWAFSTSIKDIVFSWKYFNLVALAALTAKLTIIDGTLMQKALEFYDAVDAKPIPVTNITGFAGRDWIGTGSMGENDQPGLMANWMLDSLKIWTQTGGFYPLQWEGCAKGFCYIDVEAIGFAVDCNERTRKDIDYGMILQNAASNSTNSDDQLLFDIHFESVDFNRHMDHEKATDYEPPRVKSRSGNEYIDSAGPTSYMKMHVMWTEIDTDKKTLDSVGHCPSKKFEQSCNLWPAIVKYPVQIQTVPGARTVSVGAYNHSLNQVTTTHSLNESTTIDSDTSPFDIDFEQQNGFEVMKYIRLEAGFMYRGFNWSAFGGIQMAFEMALQGKAHLSLADKHNHGFIIHQHGQAANYLPEPGTNSSTCSFNYVSPMRYYEAPNRLFTIPSVVAKINQIMFGFATDISRDGMSEDVPHHRNVALEGIRFPYTVHYRTNFEYMWGAVSATIVCVLLVLPVYWGFWQLGRKVSLNPFEIAHAFRSPVVGSASTAVTEDLMKEVGHQTIRYGPVLSGDGSGRFGVAAPEYVARVPTRGSSFRPPSSRRGFWGD